MYISNSFVFLELHKSASTHIKRIINEVTQGKSIGKHNQATQDLFLEGREFIGSIRDPWEWYVSLWAYGCDNKGGIHHNTTKRLRITGLGWSKNPLKAIIILIKIFTKNRKAWRKTYTNTNDVKAFRNWLYMIYDSQYSIDLGENYNDFKAKDVCGLMSYRYLKLFCEVADQQDKVVELTGIGEIENFVKSHCFVKSFIKCENLENDLTVFFKKHGIVLSDEQLSKIFNRPRTNISSKKRSLNDYYDQKLSDLVASKEKIIIQKFGYQPPV